MRECVFCIDNYVRTDVVCVCVIMCVRVHVFSVENFDPRMTLVMCSLHLFGVDTDVLNAHN